MAMAMAGKQGGGELARTKAQGRLMLFLGGLCVPHVLVCVCGCEFDRGHAHARAWLYQIVLVCG